MSGTLKSVAYSYISASNKPFSFDAVFIEDGRVTLDIHKKVATKKEFFEIVEEVIPILTSETDEVAADEGREVT
jgi:hypothetical protein